MRFARLVLVLSALPFAAVGAAFLLVPADMGELVGVSLAGPTASADVRAVYGGLQLGCAAFLLLAAARDAWLEPGLLGQIAFYGGLAGARLVSYLLAGLPSSLGLALHGGEVLGLALGLVAWRRLAGQGRGLEKRTA